MNDTTLKELKTGVERAVRPIGATLKRKGKMREELLAHLVSVFDEEAARLGDEQAAIQRATVRFGDPQGLSRQLQESVPWWDRCRAILENVGYRPSESALHLAAKHFLVAVLAYSLLLPILELRILMFGRGPMEAKCILALVVVGLMLLAALTSVIFSVVLAPLLNKIVPVLASKQRGRILLAVLCGLAVLWGLWNGTFFGAAVLFMLMVRQKVKEWRYQADWA
ncbi:MAG: hypothetical protein ACLQNE_17800 [Thermoguttaceae bacterium]